MVRIWSNVFGVRAASEAHLAARVGEVEDHPVEARRSPSVEAFGFRVWSLGFSV
jgi:hypothetical protein